MRKIYNKRILSDWFSAALQTSRKCGRYVSKENIMLKKFVFIITFLLASIVNAATVSTHEGLVTNIVAFPHSYGSYSENAKGLLAIYVEGLPRGCDTGEKRVVISTDHPLHDSALSIALMAKASSKKVKIAYFNECTIRPESWDFGYFLIY